MEPYHLAATSDSPELSFDPGAGQLSINGCSIPENADRLYGPLMDLLEHYATAPAPRTQVRVTLNYFNSSSAKNLLDLFKQLEDLHATGTSQVLLQWCHEQDDLDMQEAGEDYRSLLEFPVEVVEVG